MEVLLRHCLGGVDNGAGFVKLAPVEGHGAGRACCDTSYVGVGGHQGHPRVADPHRADSFTVRVGEGFSTPSDSARKCFNFGRDDNRPSPVG